MTYFDGIDNKEERIGKVIGDVLATVIIVGVFVVITYNMLNR